MIIEENLFILFISCSRMTKCSNELSNDIFFVQKNVHSGHQVQLGVCMFFFSFDFLSILLSLFSQFCVQFEAT